MGRGRETSIKKLVTCDWEVLPMTGHLFLWLMLLRGSLWGVLPFDCGERGGAGSEGSKGVTGFSSFSDNVYLKETLIKSQSQLLQEFLCIASS